MWQKPLRGVPINDVFSQLTNPANTGVRTRQEDCQKLFYIIIKHFIISEYTINIIILVYYFILLPIGKLIIMFMASVITIHRLQYFLIIS